MKAAARSTPISRTKASPELRASLRPASAARPILVPAAACAALALACGDSAPPTQPVGTPNQPPVAAFTTNVVEGSAPLEVRFDAGASQDPDGAIAAYAWTFGDGGTGSGVQVSHVYESAGSYAPTLTVTDDRGAQHTRTGAPITVESPPGTGENSISGVVWHDADADGLRDADERTIEAMIVFLDEDGDGLRDSTEVVAVSDADGRYAFAGLDHRRPYTVTQRLTLGWTNTAPGKSGSASGRAGPAVDPAHPTAAIIGGAEAEPGEFPFQVALVSREGRSQFCGGTFIAASWVLTAAHCVDGGVDPESIGVLAGAHDKTVDGEVLAVSRVYVHPAFGQGEGIANDIALLQLDGEHMYPRIELLGPDRVDLSAPGVMATVIGWGLTTEGGRTSDVLKKLEAVIISNDECQTHLDDNIIDLNICAGKQGSSEATCNGDSGGPLMVPYRDRWLQVGIVSFGTAICYQPTAFTRVSALYDYPVSYVPAERSGSVVVDWKDGLRDATADFGNFR